MPLSRLISKPGDCQLVQAVVVDSDSDFTAETSMVSTVYALLLIVERES